MPLNTPFSKTRKYQLHNQVKVFAKIQSMRRMVNISGVVFDSVNQKQLRALEELRSRFHYSIQLTIP